MYLRLPASLVAMGVLLSTFIGCRVGGVATPPTVSDLSGPWLENSSTWYFEVQVENPGNWTIEDVGVHYSLHYWPGKANAKHQGILEPTGVDSTRFRFKPDPQEFNLSDTVFYQITIAHLPPGTDNPAETTVEEIHDAPAKLVVGCRDEEIVGRLNSMRDSVLFNLHDALTWTPADGPPLGGYAQTGSHGWVSLEGQGVSIPRLTGAFALAATTSDSPGTEPPMPFDFNQSLPDLLMYEPERPDGLSDQQWQEAISDDVPEARYQLIGWAFGAVFDPQQRPRISCIPSHEWFIHEAGYHLRDGTMELTAPNEQFPGEKGVPALNVAASAIATDASQILLGTHPQPNKQKMLWHPRIWDLHVWRYPPPDPTDPDDDNSQGDTPTLSIGRSGVPGIPVLPPDESGQAFFRPHLDG